MTTSRVRREPPTYRSVTVQRTERIGPRMVRLTVGGPELEGFVLDQPAASVRLLLPSSGSTELVMPAWNGNEFLLADGSRPILRTFTPRRADPAALELDVEIVVHGGGAASTWAERAVPGDAVAVSGPGRGYAVDPDAPGFLLAGDETAIPAIGQLLEAIPAATPVEVRIEVADPSGRIDLPEHPCATVAWFDLPAGAPPGAALVEAVHQATPAEGTRIWVAGEAAAVQRIRRHLFDERGIPRGRTTVRGYWKHGRAAGGGDDDD